MAVTGERKPRRLKGTVANSASKYTALACIGFGITITAVYELLFSPMRSSLEKYGAKEFERADEDSTQATMLFPKRSPSEIKRLLEEKKDRGSH